MRIVGFSTPPITMAAYARSMLPVTLERAIHPSTTCLVVAIWPQWSSAYTAPRNAVVNAAGARIVEVEAAAGSLRVEGKQGLSQVQITGTARASSQGVLNQIRLIAERQGDRVFIKADMPDDNGWHNGDYAAALDLVIQVPPGMDADI